MSDTLKYTKTGDCPQCGQLRTAYRSHKAKGVVCFPHGTEPGCRAPSKFLPIQTETKSYVRVQGEPRDVPLYVGVVEVNRWEREVFGYYWEWSEEAEAALSKVVERYKKEGSTSYRLEFCSEQALEVMAQQSQNGYRSRVSGYETPKSWRQYMNQLAPARKPLTGAKADPFYKGRGLGEPLW